MTTYYADSAASPGGNGLSPATAFDTLAAFNAVASPLDVLVPVGEFREVLDPPALTMVLGDPANPFVVNAGEPLAGLVSCVSGDSARIGSNWAQCRKVTVSKSLFIDGDPSTANLCANGVQMDFACSRADGSDGFFYLNPQTYHTATTVATSGGNIVSFTLAALTSGLTSDQIAQCTILFVHGANKGGRSAVTLSGGALVLTTETFVYDTGNPTADNFALQNLAAAMQPGQWAYWDEGDGTVTIYVRDLSSSIEYTARDRCVDLDGKSNISVEGFIARQWAGTARSSAAVYADNPAPHQSNITLRDFQILESYGNGNPIAALYLKGIDDLIVERGTIIRAQGLFGSMFSGNNANAAVGGNPAGVVGMKRALVNRLTVRFSTSGPFRVYTCHDSVFCFLFARDVAKAAHGNDFNIYQGGYNCLVWGLNVQGIGGGYVTFQESDSLVFAFCALSASGAPNGGNRAFFSQQNTTAKQGDVYGYLGSGVLNCRGLPLPSRAASTQFQNGMTVTKGLTPLDRFHIRNNIFPGWSAEQFNPLPLSWSHNTDTSPGTASTLYGTGDIRAADEYVDPENGDFAYKPGALTRTLTASDWSSLIPGYQARWPIAPAEMWGLDAAGDEIEWDKLRRGPTMNPDADLGVPLDGDSTPVPPPVTGVVIVQGAASIVINAPAGLPPPELSGTPIDDVTYAADSGVREIDVTVAFTGDFITYSTTYGTMDGGILLADTDAPYPDPTTFTITITATNSGGSVTTTFDMTIDTLEPAVTGLTFDPDGDPNPTLAFNVNRVGPLTAVVNNTASPQPETVIAEHTTPGSETWASTQFTAVAGANSEALDISGVPDGTWWLHLVLPDGLGRYGIASAQFERTGATPTVTVFVARPDGTVDATSLAPISAATFTAQPDGTVEATV